MEPIDWAIPNWVAMSPSFAFNWFKVNTLPTDLVNYTYITAISTPCNNTAARLLIAWSSMNTITGLSNVHCKITNYGPPNGYAFKQGTTANTLKSNNQLSVHPNPSDEIIVSNAKEGQKYAILDMLGRTLQNGNIEKENQEIAIKNLSAGSYFFVVEGGRALFIKR
jgi:hypothetical protein